MGASPCLTLLLLVAETNIPKLTPVLMAWGLNGSVLSGFRACLEERDSIVEEEHVEAVNFAMWPEHCGPEGQLDWYRRLEGHLELLRMSLLQQKRD